MVNSILDTWNEPFSKAASVERTIRHQYLLRGYEMGRGGQRLGPEEAVDFLEQYAQVVEADVKEATREERQEMRLMMLQAGCPDAIEDNMKAIAKRMVHEALPHWRDTRADILLTVMQKKPELWGIRVGGRRGVAFVKYETSNFWNRVFGRARKTARVGVRWEDGTSSDLHTHQAVEWCLVIFPAFP